MSQNKRCGGILAITLPNLNRFSQLFHCKKEDEISNKTYTKSQHSLMALLHYLVKCTTHYYCNVPYRIERLADVFQFIDILNTQLIGMLLMMSQIVMPSDWGRGCLIWWYEVWCCLLQKLDGVAVSLCHRFIMLKDKELSWQLTSGTRMCELACMVNGNNLSKIYYYVSNWWKFERAWNFNMVISARAICVIFKYLRFSM